MCVGGGGGGGIPDRCRASLLVKENKMIGNGQELIQSNHTF